MVCECPHVVHRQNEAMAYPTTMFFELNRPQLYYITLTLACNTICETHRRNHRNCEKSTSA